MRVSVSCWVREARGVTQAGLGRGLRLPSTDGTRGKGQEPGLDPRPSSGVPQFLDLPELGLVTSPCQHQDMATACVITPTHPFAQLLSEYL